MTSARTSPLAEPQSGSPSQSTPQSPVLQAARRAKAAAADLAPLPRAAKDAALSAIADALEARTPEIVAANAEDVERARAAGAGESIVDRLTLTPERVAAIASDVR
ncbi:gamma-glutamyl-phosphate reductase, partial [Streptomyces sp. H27-D2]|nr:gamma-glutamyl-phosphate reductase [Streptomyces sp. H27-D2]